MKKIAVLALLTAGCATLFNADQTDILMETHPGGAEVWVDGAHRGVTPMVIKLGNHEPHVIVFKRRGFKDHTCVIDTEVEAKWIVLDVVLGLIPVLIDGMTGEWKSLTATACTAAMQEDGG